MEVDVARSLIFGKYRIFECTVIVFYCDTSRGYLVSVVLKAVNGKNVVYCNLLSIDRISLWVLSMYLAQSMMIQSDQNKRLINRSKRMHNSRLR